LKRLILLGFFVALIFVVSNFGQLKSEEKNNYPTPELVSEPHNEEIFSNQEEQYTNEVDNKFKANNLKGEITELSKIVDFQSIFNIVSFSDKVTIGDILLTHFNFKELREYQAKVSDGITSEEKDELLKVFVERVPKEDTDRIMAIANKYVAVLATSTIGQ